MNEDELMLEGGEQEQPMDDMTPDEAAASLAFATKLSEGMMPQAMPEGDMGAEMPQGEEQMMETPQEPALDPEALKNDIMAEVKDMVKTEMDGLKDLLKQALEEDDDEEESKTKETAE